MNQCLLPGEPAGVGTLRVIRGQLKLCSRQLGDADGDSDANIHGVRKRLKRTRSLLRLIRPHLPPRDFRAFNRALRKTAHELAEARASAALLVCFSGLCQASPHDVTAIRAELERTRHHARPSPTRRKQIAEELEEVHRAARNLRIPRGWKAIAEGFEATYREGKRWHRRALRDNNSETHHEWRKWVKHHLYHIQLLEPIWPTSLSARRAALKATAEELGDEHDLTELRTTLLKQSLTGTSPETLRWLLGEIEKRRSHLRNQAQSSGARLYVDSPRTQTRRHRQLYTLWLAETRLLDESTRVDQ